MPDLSDDLEKSLSSLRESTGSLGSGLDSSRGGGGPYLDAWDGRISWGKALEQDEGIEPGSVRGRALDKRLKKAETYLQLALDDDDLTRGHIRNAMDSLESARRYVARKA